MKYSQKFMGILPGLDDFIDEWNRQAEIINRRNKEKLLEWGV